MPDLTLPELFDELVKIGEDAHAAGDELVVDHVRNQLTAVQAAICEKDPQNERCPPSDPREEKK